MVRLLAHRMLLILAVPIVFLGLIDPLEGGITLLLAGLVYVIAFLIIGKGPQKYLWVPFLSSLVIGALVLFLAVFGIDRTDSSADLTPLVVGNWIYRVSVLATLMGAITTSILAFRAKK